MKSHLSMRYPRKQIQKDDISELLPSIQACDERVASAGRDCANEFVPVPSLASLLAELDRADVQSLPEECFSHGIWGHLFILDVILRIFVFNLDVI